MIQVTKENETMTVGELRKALEDYSDSDAVWAYRANGVRQFVVATETREGCAIMLARVPMRAAEERKALIAKLVAMGRMEPPKRTGRPLGGKNKIDRRKKAKRTKEKKATTKLSINQLKWVERLTDEQFQEWRKKRVQLVERARSAKGKTTKENIQDETTTENSID